MSLLKIEAEVLRLGLIVGYFDIVDAVRWADALIEAEDKTEVAVLEVALADGQSRAEVAARLAAVPGEADPAAVARLVLAELLRALDEQRLPGDVIARSLYSFALAGDLPDDVLGPDALCLEDYFVGVQEGWGGTYEHALADLRAYLAEHSAIPADKTLPNNGLQGTPGGP